MVDVSLSPDEVSILVVALDCMGDEAAEAASRLPRGIPDQLEAARILKRILALRARFPRPGVFPVPG